MLPECLVWTRCFTRYTGFMSGVVGEDRDDDGIDDGVENNIYILRILYNYY
jgi:hypothetical protein